MNLSTKLLAVGVSLSISSCLLAQKTEERITRYFDSQHSAIGLTPKDYSDFILKNEHESKQFNVSYAYAQQRYQGIEIHNAINSFLITSDSIILTANRFEKNISSRINSTSPKIDQKTAILNAINDLGFVNSDETVILKTKTSEGIDVYRAPQISNNDITIHLCIESFNNKLRLAWNISIQPNMTTDWWSTRIDAITGELLNKNNWMLTCSFEGNCSDHDHSKELTSKAPSPNSYEQALIMPPPPSTDQYNVFSIPVESPNHGSRSLITGPSDPIASPFGWHDDDGVAGEEYTITRGNNVYASEDTDDDNVPGYSPDGGASLNFDFPLNLNQEGTGFWDPAITNLFYMNNMMHDVWYHYGFDEASGNFQGNNYGNGGLGDDYVNADAQDGSGTNNANFGTPPDGSNPRMQMYMWSASGTTKVISITGPTAIEGLYSASGANFGPGVPTIPVTGNLILFDDGTGDSSDACEPAINGGDLNGNIAVIRRGTCDFTYKVVQAENEGAIGVIIVNTSGGTMATMGGTDPGIGIPSVMVTFTDGENFIDELEAGQTVTGAIGDFGPFDYDSDFDNGIIAHEYGHGISNRLTGGGQSADCLYNSEQMGEGWSDWFALMMTIEPGDQGSNARGIGTYAIGEATNGPGIRPAPYSTDFSVNGYTYSSTNSPTLTEPHGIGFVWCSMLWDLTWALIDQYGFDPDIHNGTGGNNIAMHLIMNGMKLQPCSPGFVDGRDAILAADEALYGGTHKCLIWEIFAKRGLGFSADQGSSFDRNDQVGAFDLPPSIDHITSATVYCGDYTWAVNGQTYDSTGTYYASITPTAGCDSIATLNLTVNNSINSVVTYDGPSTLVSMIDNVSYQWLQCGSGYTVIPGATNQSFTPTEVGLYAVVATEGVCNDTSVCMFINEINGIDELNLSNITVAPNPTTGDISVYLGKDYNEISAHVVNALGQIVFDEEFDNTDYINCTIDGASGIYFIALEADGKSGVVKVIKE